MTVFVITSAPSIWASSPSAYATLSWSSLLFADASTRTTLFHTLDCCQSPMGKRLLRSTLLHPMLDAVPPKAASTLSAELHVALQPREKLRQALSGVLDVVASAGGASPDSAGPRECACARRIPRAVPARKPKSLAPLAGSALAAITSTPRPPRRYPHRDRNFARPGAAPHPRRWRRHRARRAGRADEPRTLSQSGRQSIAAIEERERQRTGIGSLKVCFNNVFGYYIEITKSNLKAVPSDYERKQTLVNAERFTTPELKDYETRVLTAHERAIEIERRLFAELRSTILAAAPRIRRSAALLAEIDLLANFAHVAALPNYTRPVLTEGCVLEAAAARHPVVERRMEENAEGGFGPNHLYPSH